ncbi:MFS transporter [Pseudarthrobacter sp. SSS035]|uniref:MFS transporter n=1 Tax=Pseudarthrobacter sp. SSS035 TaxID=2931399 RepID=UPI00200F9079|nr:MFS transporter [Pseudarthrobacter sp. SSS035]
MNSHPVPTAPPTEGAPALQAVRPLRWAVILLTFLAVVLDGFDTASMGLSIPSLSAAWGATPAAFTAPLIATNAGVVIGYIACWRISAQLGLRLTLIGGTAIFAVGSAVTALSGDITMMALARLITGFGLGAVLPSAVSLATHGASARTRERLAVLVTMGLSAGSLAAGLSGGNLIGAYGWQSIFWVGAILPTVLLPMMWFGIADVRITAQHRGLERSGVGSLFGGGMTPRTLLLWAFAFLIFTTFYAFSSWLPTLLLSYGFSPSMAPLGAASLGIGGILGASLLIIFAGKFPTSRMLIAAGALAIVFLMLVSFTRPGPVLLLILFTGVGAGLASSMVGQAAVAVSAYSEASRTAGVGWASAMGRMGSIAGPAAGGLMLAAGQSAQTVVVMACAPVVLAVVAMTLLARRTAGKTPSMTRR